MNLCPTPARTPNINCLSAGGGATTAGAPGMFAGGPKAYRFKDCSDGLSKTLLLGETLPVYSSFMMYFCSALNIATTNPPPNNHLIYTGCPKAPLSRIGDCYAHMGGFMSEHTGGFQAALADGSVRFIAETIEYDVYQYLGNKSDAQLFGDY